MTKPIFLPATNGLTPAVNNTFATRPTATKPVAAIAKDAVCEALLTDTPKVIAPLTIGFQINVPLVCSRIRANYRTAAKGIKSRHIRHIRRRRQRWRNTDINRNYPYPLGMFAGYGGE